MDQDDKAARQAKVSKALSSAYLAHQIQELESKVNAVNVGDGANAQGRNGTKAGQSGPSGRDGKTNAYDEYEFPPLGSVAPPRERVVTGSRDLSNGFPTLEEGRHAHGHRRGHDHDHRGHVGHHDGHGHHDHHRHGRHSDHDSDHGHGRGHGRGRGRGRGGRGRGGAPDHKEHRHGRIDDSTEKTLTDTDEDFHGRHGRGRGGRRGRGPGSHGSHGSRSFVREDEGDDEGRDTRKWRVVVLDSSALMWAPNQVRRLVNQGWEVIVPLEALKTLDLLKGGNSPSARAARAATRYIEHASRHYRPHKDRRSKGKTLENDSIPKLGSSTSEPPLNDSQVYRGGRGLRLQSENETKPPEEISSLPIPPSSGDADEVLPKWMINVLSCAAYFTAITNELSTSTHTEPTGTLPPPMSPEDDNQAVLFVANPSFESESMMEHSFIDRGEGFLVSQEAQRFEIPLEILRDDEEVEERRGERGERGRGRGRGRGGKRGGRRGDEGHEESKEKEEPTQVRILVRPAPSESVLPPPIDLEKGQDTLEVEGTGLNTDLARSDTKASPSVPGHIISSPSISSPIAAEGEDLRKSMELSTLSASSPLIPPPEFSPRIDHLEPGSLPSPVVTPRFPRAPRPPAPPAPGAPGGPFIRPGGPRPPRPPGPPGPPPFPGFMHPPPRPGFPHPPPFPPHLPHSPHARPPFPPHPPYAGFSPFGPRPPFAPGPPPPPMAGLNPEAPPWRGAGNHSDTSSTSSDSDDYSHTFSHGSQEGDDDHHTGLNSQNREPSDTLPPGRGIPRGFGFGRGRGDRGGFRGRGGGPGPFASAPPGSLGQDWPDRGRGRGRGAGSGPGRGGFRGRGEGNFTLLRRGGPSALAGYSSLDSTRAPDPAFDRPKPTSKHLWDENRASQPGRRDDDPRDHDRRAAHTHEDREKSTREREKLGRFLEKAKERNERDRERELERAEKRREKEQRAREKELERAERDVDRAQRDIENNAERIQRDVEKNAERVQRDVEKNVERIQREVERNTERLGRQLEKDAERRQRQFEKVAERRDREMDTAAQRGSREFERAGREKEAALYTDDGPKMVLLQRPK